MKNKIPIIMVTVMMITACLVMTGCGKIIGSWQLSELEVGGNTYTIEELAEAVNSQKADEVSIILEINEGDFTLSSDGEVVAEGACVETEDGYALNINGGSVNAEISGGELILHDTSSEVESKMVFVKK